MRLTGTAGGLKGIPLETFSANKDMGRILLRRGGETIAAGNDKTSRSCKTRSNCFFFLCLGVVLEIL